MKHIGMQDQVQKSIRAVYCGQRGEFLFFMAAGIFLGTSKNILLTRVNELH